MTGSHHHALHHLVANVPQIIKKAVSTAAVEKNDTKWIEITQYSTMLNGVDQHTNLLLKDISWTTLGALALLILLLRICVRFKAHLRHLAGMGLAGEKQQYWATNRGSWWWFKKNVVYAPLKHKRHNREVNAGKLHMGTIPSRFHTLLIFSYFATNLAYCAHLHYTERNHYKIVAELRGRTGVMAIINMVPLVIFAGRNNPLIGLLQISFDTYNLLHRWMGRMVVLQSVVHTLCWYYVKHAGDGWGGVWSAMTVDAFIGWGCIGTGALMLILVLSLSPVRHAFYETFLTVHIILAAVTVAGVYIHCKMDQLPFITYIQAIGFLWLGDRFGRVYLTVRNNYSRKGKGWTTATVQALPGEACRVTMHLPTRLDVRPGTHAYLRFGSINAWENHPFSIAWVDHISKEGILPLTEKAMDIKIRKSDTVTDVSFVIQAQKGLTRRLYNKANEVSPRVWKVRASLEGPYAGHHSLDSYGHAVLIAGASGITHQLPYVRHLVHGYHNNTVATRKVLLIWIVRDAEQLEWVRPWMDKILCMPGRREVLTIKLFITRPKNPREITSPSATVMMYPGRPNIKTLVATEVQNQFGAMAVTVCGPGGLQDNVREAVRDVQEDGVVDYIEESFTYVLTASFRCY